MARGLQRQVVNSIALTLSSSRVSLTLIPTHPRRTTVMTLALLADVLTPNITLSVTVGSVIVKYSLSRALLAKGRDMGNSPLYTSEQKSSTKEEHSAYFTAPTFRKM